MNGTIKLRNLTLGEGRSKICAPMVGKTYADLKKELEDFHKVPFDLVEWRIDFFNDVFDMDKVKETLGQLRKDLGDIPMIFTFRTKAEGGNLPCSEAQYLNLVKAVAATGQADLIDVEFAYGDAIKEISEIAHKSGTKVILSHHNFEKTYPKEEIVAKLEEMLKYDGDLSKIALMPQSMQDVYDLLSASTQMKEQHPERPMITISMGKLGVLSRIYAECAGSVITFGAASGSSAPGQINTVDLLTTLEIIHKTCS